MRREEVLQRLRQRRAELARYGVKSLALFGSIARDEAGPHSDIDVLVEFEERATFDRYIDLQSFLEVLLDCPVDLVTQQAIRPRTRPYVEKEAVRVT